MGFIVDQWGVLHDGTSVYPEVIDCLQELKNRHKIIIVLSNSTQKADETRENLQSMGIDPALCDYIITSGELVSQGLLHDKEGPFKDLGKRCYVFGQRQADKLFVGTSIEIVDDVTQADFLLIAGINGPSLSVDDFVPILKEAVRKGLKAICVNPDSHALLGASYLMGPGLIARRYQDFGGVVKYIGKPHGPIFQHCIRLLQTHEIYPAQTVMIGDTMAHDIMGAHFVNIDTCLVKNGMHAGVFRNATTPAEVDRTLDILITHYNHIRPRFLVDRFEWGKALPDRKHKVHKKHVRRKPAVSEDGTAKSGKKKATDKKSDGQ